MKLTKLCESKYIVDKEEIKEILAACDYHKKWSIDKNDEITLASNFFLNSNLQIFLTDKNLTTLPLKIKKAKVFKVMYSVLSNYDFLPQQSSEIRLSNLHLDYEHLDIDIDITDVLYLYNINGANQFSFSFKSCDYLNIYNCNSLYSINIKNSFLNSLSIDDCNNINLNDTFVISNNLHHISLNSMLGITGFNMHIKSTNTLSLTKLSNLQSWRNIENYKILLYLNINNTDQLNNFINVMLLETDKITNDNKSIDFTKYTTVKNRSDYIMDFAVELIDAGFPEAAEL